MGNERPDHTYIGIKPCGCIWFCQAGYTDNETAKDIAKETMYAVTHGYEVRRLPTDEALPMIRTRFGDCDVCREPEQMSMGL